MITKNLHRFYYPFIVALISLEIQAIQNKI